MAKQNPVQSRRRVAAAAQSNPPQLAGPGPRADGLLRLGLYPVILVTVIAFLCICPVEEYDLWFHLGFARYLFDHGAFPPGDVFSFTSRGREWVSTGWLGAVILHLLWTHVRVADGALGIVFFILFQVGAAFLSVYVVAARRRLHAPMCLLLLPALAAACLRFNARPDVSSLWLLSVVLLILVTSETVSGGPPDSVRSVRLPVSQMDSYGAWRLWLLPPLIALWANLHAGFVVGVAVVGVYGAFRLHRWYVGRHRLDLMALGPCGLCALTWMANPYGVSMLGLASKIKALPGVTKMLFEWMPLFGPPGNLMPTFSYFALGTLLAGCGAALLVRTTRVPWWHWVTAALLMGITINARRHLALAAVGLPVLMLPHLGGAARRLRRVPLAAPVGALFGAVLLCGLQFQGDLASGGGWPVVAFDSNAFPVGAADFLQAHRPPPNMFNSFHYGGYLLHRLGPETKVFIDGRIDTYAPSVWVDDRAIESGALPWDAAVAKYGFNVAVIDRRSGYDPGKLAARIPAHPDWKLVFQDSNSLVFVRATDATREYLDSLK